MPSGVTTIEQAMANYVASHGNVAAIAWDNQNTVVYCNKAFIDMLQIDFAVVGKSVFDFLRFPDYPECKFGTLTEPIQSSVSLITMQGEYRCGSTVFPLDDGHIACCERPVLLQSDIVEKMARMNLELTNLYWESQKKNRKIEKINEQLQREIAERKQAEEALKRSAETQAVLLKIAEAAIIAPSLEELYREVHRLISKFLPNENFHLALLDEVNNEIVDGYSVDITNAVPKRRPKGKGLTEYAMRQGHTVHVTQTEISRLLESGEVIRQKTSPIYEWLGAPLFNAAGKSFGVIAVVSRDAAHSFQPGDIEVISIIAAQVSMAIERKQAETKLGESEDKYRQLFEMESDAIFLIDAQNGAIMDVNAAAVGLYGYSREELLQMRNVDLSAEPQETKKAGDTAAASGVVVIPIRYHRKKDGTVFPVEINATSLLWKEKPVFIPAIRDITERMRRKRVCGRARNGSALISRKTSR